ncbi:hypothetical protein [Nocardia sp. GTS18]|uniref:hypothetical protein n=1 Tax=Nocardia sp. GTS18 TaxID=1778064 RepID=UPI0015EF5020|nr:hypothetical protein [Nocardia sp. GTS18]
MAGFGELPEFSCWTAIVRIRFLNRIPEKLIAENVGAVTVEAVRDNSGSERICHRITVGAVSFPTQKAPLVSGMLRSMHESGSYAVPD